MTITGQNGVSAFAANGAILLVPERRIAQAIPPDSPIPSNPLKDLYFYAYLSPTGEEVWIAPGLLVVDTLAYSGLGINVDGGGPTTPFVVSSFTPSTSGYIYYEAEVDEEQQVINPDSSTTSTPPTAIGSGTYGFSISSRTFGTCLVSGFSEGTMVYSTTRPLAEAGFYRKVICRVTVDADGLPHNVRQEHVGHLHISAGEVFTILTMAAGAA